MRGEVLTPAKLNWDLRVLGRRADGFHELRSWFLALEWSDRLTAEPTRGGDSSLALVGDAADGVPADASNLVLRAERAWRESFLDRAHRVPPLRWTLDKQIPPGAGLGGGSGNAAGALALLEAFAGAQGADRARLHAMALQLGSDLPFFLEHRGGAEWRGGRGEILLGAAPLPTTQVVVAVPALALATNAVYAALAAPLWTGEAPSRPEAPSPTPGPNQLSAAALRVAPALAAWITVATEHFPLVMSGSGSAHFAVATGHARERAQVEALERRSRHLRLTRLLEGPALRIRME